MFTLRARCLVTSLVLPLLPSSLGCSRELFAQSDDSGAQATVAATTPTIPAVAATTPTIPAVAATTPTTSACNEQPPQEALVRAHLNSAPKSAAERREQLGWRKASIAYRTKNYGRFEGFGPADANNQSPKQLSELTRFFGIPVVLNRRVIPALECVEAQLRVECAQTPYQPRILSGLRHKNTYFDGEVSNHVYGIAIDVDPQQNPCCHCVLPWSASKRCEGEKTVWERMDMPKCWVDVFERFGFYWLGHDPLEDTMHFEFLGDPERIRRH